MLNIINILQTWNRGGIQETQKNTEKLSKQIDIPRLT